MPPVLPHHLTRLVLPLLTLLALGGCAAIGPDYRTPTPPTPATWSGVAAQPAEDI